MKLTKENIDTLPIPEKEKILMKCNIEDILEINDIIANVLKLKKTFYIYWQDYHDEYSPERVDPCPDFYGTYTIECEEHPGEVVGIHMNEQELEVAILTLFDFLHCLELS